MQHHTTFTDDQIREACNDEKPIEAFIIALIVFQRMTAALERIAENSEPITMVLQRSDDDEDSHDGTGPNNTGTGRN